MGRGRSSAPVGGSRKDGETAREAGSLCRSVSVGSTGAGHAAGVVCSESIHRAMNGPTRGWGLLKDWWSAHCASVAVSAIRQRRGQSLNHPDASIQGDATIIELLISHWDVFPPQNRTRAFGGRVSNARICPKRHRARRQSSPKERISPSSLPVELTHSSSLALSVFGLRGFIRWRQGLRSNSLWILTKNRVADSRAGNQ